LSLIYFLAYCLPVTANKNFHTHTRCKSVFKETKIKRIEIKRKKLSEMNCASYFILFHYISVEFCRFIHSLIAPFVKKAPTDEELISTVYTTH